MKRKKWRHNKIRTQKIKKSLKSSVLKKKKKKQSFRKINALIHAKLGIDPETIKDVNEWIELYSRADYALKVERKIQYSAFKQALVEVANQLFKKEED